MSLLDPLRRWATSTIDAKLGSVNPASSVRELLESPPSSETLARAIDACPGGWAIDSALARVLVNAVTLHGARSVLEFGAGASSVLLATALDESGGGKLTSVERDPSWCADQWASVEAFDKVDAQLVASPVIDRIGRLGVYASHRGARGALCDRGPYDFVLVDGPQYYHGREGALPLAFDLLTTDCLIAVDDASRSSEKLAIWKWLKTYPGLALDSYEPSLNREGIAILRKRSADSPRLSPVCFAVGAAHGYRRRRIRRRSGL